MEESLVLADLDLAHDEVPDLHERIDGIREHGPVVPVRYHGQRAWLIVAYEEIRQAFLDEVHFASEAFYREHAAPSMGRTMQAMAGEEHQVNRKLVSRSFLPRRVESFVEGCITEEAVRRVDAMKDAEEVDLVEALARPFPFSVITRLLGLPVEDESRFLEWALKLIDYPWDPEGALRARREFTQYLAPVLERRRSEPGDDVLSVLASAEPDGERLSDEEIFSFCRLLFPAGSDTAYKNLGSLLTALLTTPGMADRARGSDADRGALVQEGLRWQPPVANLPRTCSRDIVLAGTPIKAGDPMLFGLAAGNRDPEVFSDPHRFDPDRANSHQHLSFGHGAHFCLGSHLARRELETGIKVLFERFPKLELVAPESVEIVGCVLRGPRELRVSL